MKIRIVSLCWGTAWPRYGYKFAESFADYWPVDVELVIVSDQPHPLRRGRIIPLETVPGCREFLSRWGDDPRANGLDRPQGAKVDEEGRSWRHNAVKWMPQALAPLLGLGGLADGDIFVWFDADTETTSPVPAGWIEGILGDYDVACLQREGTHSEIGFYAMRVSPATRAALLKFADFYRAGTVFDLPEWHSAYVWDRAIEARCLRVKNLSPGMRGHVFPHTVLAKHVVHHKGKRKDR